MRVGALRVLLGGLSLLFMAAGVDAQDPSEQVLRSRFEGVWQLAVSPAQAQRVIDAAVDRAVSHMNFFYRPIARPMLRDSTPVNRVIALHFSDGNRLTTRFDRLSYTTVLGRARDFRTPDDEPMRLTQHFREGRLEQVFEAERGTRWNTYTPLADGRLRLSVTMSSSFMPQPMRFELDYRRTPTSR